VFAGEIRSAFGQQIAPDMPLCEADEQVQRAVENRTTQKRSASAAHRPDPLPTRMVAHCGNAFCPGACPLPIWMKAGSYSHVFTSTGAGGRLENLQAAHQHTGTHTMRFTQWQDPVTTLLTVYEVGFHTGQAATAPAAGYLVTSIFSQGASPRPCGPEFHSCATLRRPPHPCCPRSAGRGQPFAVTKPPQPRDLLAVRRQVQHVGQGGRFGLRQFHVEKVASPPRHANPIRGFVALDPHFTDGVAGTWTRSGCAT